MDILDAVKILRPGTAWNLKNGELIQVDDSAPRVSVPTWAEVNKVLSDNAYVMQRKMAYPDVTDQLDAIWKWFSVNYTNLPKETLDMLSTIQSIKATYPKPTDVSGK